MLVVAVLLLITLSGCAQGAIDADKAAELSRKIREHYRETGANWVSPKMLREMNLTRNSKPIMYVLSSTSCADCREFLASFKSIHPTSLSSITSQFLSVLALDDYVLEMGPAFSPPKSDYLPRVFFGDSDGQVNYDFINPNSEASAPFYYFSAEELVGAMRRFLQQHRQQLGSDVYPADLQQDM
ncbi:hypothetical protein Agub_g4463 [Astrephomene gubernaculifera]|uniref:Thioredoxin family protein n=1 Tax=Astrephomene gubernaculifera TaxID=47775 RepID=A0AAD3DMM9_9CHLO|nr:hypothetical protein Agub_g4463 [Astrephomene gubernaculifera]